MKDGGFERLTLAQIKKKWFNIYAKYKVKMLYSFMTRDIVI